MNLIQYASKKERVHVEQIIREQPVLKDADNVTIKTISVRKSLGLTMDVFAPAAVSDEPLPVLVDIHGGGLIAGRKEQNRNFLLWRKCNQWQSKNSTTICSFLTKNADNCMTSMSTAGTMSQSLSF